MTTRWDSAATYRVHVKRTEMAVKGRAIP